MGCGSSAPSHESSVTRARQMSSNGNDNDGMVYNGGDEGDNYGGGADVVGNYGADVVMMEAAA
ncbi:unnamed protein product, partial [Rotaria sp. Silwood2]